MKYKILSCILILSIISKILYSNIKNNQMKKVYKKLLKEIKFLA